MLHLHTATVIALLISTVLPLVSSLVTTVHMPPEVAGIVTLLLATVTGFLTEWHEAGDGFRWQTAAGLAALSFLTAAVARARIWIGSRTDAKLLAVGSKTA
jgi:uncharacterized membrane-anchored protein